MQKFITQGQHSCTLKPEVKSDVQYTRQWVERYPRISFKKLKPAVIQQLLDASNSEEAENAVYRITTQAYHKIRRDNALDPNTEPVKVHSIHAVALLKKTRNPTISLEVFI